MSKFRAGFAAAIFGCALMAPASALAADISIPLDTVVANGVAEGDRFELALVSSNDLVGEMCAVRATRGGEGAAHPGNDLIVTSGGESTTLSDVERESGATTDGAAPITLANTITVELVMGPDRHYAGDIDLEFDCGQSVAAFRSAPERAQDAGGFELPLTGSPIVFTIAIGAGAIGVAVALMTVARSRPSPRQT